MNEHDSQKNKLVLCNLASLEKMFSEDVLNQRDKSYTSFLPK